MNLELDENKSGDYTSFLSNSNDIMIVSDLEGTCPTAHYKKVFDHIKSGKKTVFIGDSIDYTGIWQYGPENACGITALKHLVTGMEKGNVKCLVGNRELNKIKLIALNQLENPNIKWWTQGSSISEIAINLLKKMYGDKFENITYNGGKLFNYAPASIWKVTKLVPFYPFWAPNRVAIKEGWFDKKTKPESNTLFDRYNSIFGSDPKDGTMTAESTHKYMYAELGINIADITNELAKKDISSRLKNSIIKPEELIESYRLLNRNITNKSKPEFAQPMYEYYEKYKTEEFKKEIQAAIVFTVYARLLDDDLNSELQYSNQLGNLDGYLYKYLVNSQCASYGDVGNTLYLISHGGISDKFLSSTETTFETVEKFDKWNRVLSDPEVPKPQSGGADTYVTDIIKTKINTFNKQYKERIYAFFADKTDHIKSEPEPKPTIKMLSLLSICTPIHNHPAFKENNYYTTSDISPVQAFMPMAAKLIELQNNSGSHKLPEGKKIVNIFGHMSAGGGYRFGKLQGNDNMFFINTDISNGFMKDTRLLLGDIEVTDKNKANYNSNYLVLYLTTSTGQNTLRLDGKITFRCPIQSVPDVSKKIKEIENNRTQPDYFTDVVYGALGDVRDLIYIQRPNPNSDPQKIDKPITLNYNFEVKDGEFADKFAGIPGHPNLAFFGTATIEGENVEQQNVRITYSSSTTLPFPKVIGLVPFKEKKNGFNNNLQSGGKCSNRNITRTTHRNRNSKKRQHNNKTNKNKKRTYKGSY